MNSGPLGCLSRLACPHRYRPSAPNTPAPASRPAPACSWWVVLGLDTAAGKPKLVLRAIGDTNLEGLVSQLNDDEIEFGCARVMGIDPKGPVTR
jgi:hypothetical protein